MPSFDERAADWDTPDKIERAVALASLIRSSIAIPPTARAVELGAGTGLLGLALRDTLPQGFAELVLTDPSAGMLEVAAGKIERRGLTAVRTASFDLATD